MTETTTELYQQWQHAYRRAYGETLDAMVSLGQEEMVRLASNTTLLEEHGVRLVEQLKAKLGSGWSVMSVDGIITSNVFREMCARDLPPEVEDAVVEIYTDVSSSKAREFLLREPYDISTSLVMRILRGAPTSMEYLVDKSTGDSIPKDPTLPAACYAPWVESNAEVRSFLKVVAVEGGVDFNDLLVMLSTWRGTTQEVVEALKLVER